jgi:hypothetical protein
MERHGHRTTYDAGRRFNSISCTALHAKVWRGYLATGRADLRDKLIKMARFVSTTATIRRTAEVYVRVLATRTGTIGARRNASTSATYDISLVNTLVWGYKLTGDVNLRTVPRPFPQGTRWAEGEPQRSGQGPGRRTDVYAFVDTRKNAEQRYFTHNKDAPVLPPAFRERRHAR